MKRALIENHRVILGQGAVDRGGFLSAVFALKVPGEIADGIVADVLVEHSDTEDGGFEAVSDKEVYPAIYVGDKKGTLEGISVSQSEDINIDIDLVGCKRFIKVTAAFRDKGGESVQIDYNSAVVLGDAVEVPV